MNPRLQKAADEAARKLRELDGKAEPVKDTQPIRIAALLVVLAVVLMWALS